MTQRWNEIMFLVDALTEEIITEYFESDKIDVNKFWMNYECLLRRHEGAQVVSWGGVETERISSSLCLLLSLKSLFGFPVWFVSAYPDVVYWQIKNNDKEKINQYRQLIDKYLDKSGKKLECAVDLI